MSLYQPANPITEGARWFPLKGDAANTAIIPLGLFSSDPLGRFFCAH